jgi:rare lipoprotein A
MAAPPSAARRQVPLAVPLVCLPLLTCLMATLVQTPTTTGASQQDRVAKVWTTLASWYGPALHGLPTASGETFDMFAATVAHPSLPFGSRLRIVNPKTGRSQTVRVNDRGPFVEGRELDVSYRVASRLGLLERGVGRVIVELLEAPARP